MGQPIMHGWCAELQCMTSLGMDGLLSLVGWSVGWLVVSSPWLLFLETVGLLCLAGGKEQFLKSPYLLNTFTRQAAMHTEAEAYGTLQAMQTLPPQPTSLCSPALFCFRLQASTLAWPVVRSSFLPGWLDL